MIIFIEIVTIQEIGCFKDYSELENFYNWFLKHPRRDAQFLRKILWTVEANFSHDRFFIRRNSHPYSLENSQVYIFGEGDIGNKLIGCIIILN